MTMNIKRRVRRGFTLIEVLLVMVILVVVSSLAYPSIASMYGNIRLTAGVDMVRGAWAEARAQAIEDGVAYRFAVSQDMMKYKLAPDRDEIWSGGSTTLSDIADTIVKSETFPETVSIDLGTANGETFGEWISVVTFLPDGACDKDTSVKLRSSGARPVLLRVRAMTGHVTTTTLPREDR
jgi:prepilin-type N-terminal cleavage/methylation domain-containing protein